MALEIEVEFDEVNVAVLDAEVVADIVFVRVDADEPVAEEEALDEPLADELEA